MFNFQCFYLVCLNVVCFISLQFAALLCVFHHSLVGFGNRYFTMSFADGVRCHLSVSPSCAMFPMFIYFPSLKVLSLAMVHWVALVAMKWRSNMPEGFRPASHPSPVRGNLSAPLSTSNSTSPPLPSVQMSPLRGTLSLCKASASPSQHLSPQNLPPVFKNHL